MQMPPTQANEIARLRYAIKPAAGGYASHRPAGAEPLATIDQDDTNWIVILKDVGPDVSVHGAASEVDIPTGLSERELTRGWLKPRTARLIRSAQTVAAVASAHRAAQSAVRAQQDRGIQDRILSTGNLFKETATAFASISPASICRADLPARTISNMRRITLQQQDGGHKIYHDEQHPSHLVLPIIPGVNTSAFV
jgi:hypothetical protein